uniref:Variant surface glycoprotein 1779 n=1 Tax=Trypanosoma brucei TaxID=5691 RepID=M4SX89_9TRYP|nr:variant surface glycoprotein 1779 [Trypanosoma brucei]
MQKQVFYLTVTTILFKQATAAPKGGNVEVMAKLCGALRLGDNTITFEPQEETGFEGEPTVLKLNMSLAPKEWRDKFVNRSGPNKVEPITTPPQGTPDDWAAMWPRWAAIEAELSKQDGEAKLLKAYNLETASTAQKELIRQQVAAYADAVVEALHVSESKPNADDNALTAAVNTAIYGKDKNAAQALDHKALTGNEAAAYANSCGNAGGITESKTLAHAVACVCGTANGKRNEEPCIKAGTGNVEWEVGGLPQASQWTTIRAACPKVATQPLTAARIRAALATAATAVVTIGTTPT